MYVYIYICRPHQDGGGALSPEPGTRWRAPTWRISLEKAFDSKLSGNEVCFTNSLEFLRKNMLCSKLHYQRVLIQKPFHIRSRQGSWRVAIGTLRIFKETTL